MRDYKLVVLGAGGVGKSCLTVQFVQGVYLDSYDPTIEDSYRKTIEIDNKVFDLEILDTAGIAQFTAMRELYIKSGMGFLLVYSVTDKQSLNELMALREQVLRIKDSKRVPMVLVGNKADLADERIISVEDGIAVSSKWGKIPFYETSALLRSNVDEVFVDLVRQIIRNEMENVAKSDVRNPTLANINKTSSLRSTSSPGSSSRKYHNGSVSEKNTKNNTPNTSNRHSRPSTPLTQSNTATGHSKNNNTSITNMNNGTSSKKQAASHTNKNTNKTTNQKTKKKKKSSCTIL